MLGSCHVYEITKVHSNEFGKSQYALWGHAYLDNFTHLWAHVVKSLFKIEDNVLEVSSQISTTWL